MQSNVLLSTIILPGWVFKLKRMVYEKRIMWTEKDKIMK